MEGGGGARGRRILDAEDERTWVGRRTGVEGRRSRVHTAENEVLREEPVGGEPVQFLGGRDVSRVVQEP